MNRRLLPHLYRSLLKHFGAQHWWPGDSPFEVMIGAILTQNTSWKNVERSIKAIKDAKLMNAEKMSELNESEIGKLIRSSGFYNIKARRLASFLSYLKSNGVNISRIRKNPRLRSELLAVHGIGKETADSILLYAFGIPYFVIDSYTRRIMSRIGVIDSETISYDDLQDIFHRYMERDAQVYNEYHALLVALAKAYCKKRPECTQCPVSKDCMNNKRKVL